MKDQSLVRVAADRREAGAEPLGIEAALVDRRHREEDRELIERGILLDERERHADERDALLDERERALRERERGADLREDDLDARQRRDRPADRPR